ncbi:MAG TPA: hemerythrin domain-containing protein [Cyclobacteriaceae bacterium]|nr:hemerythrin domain-containing protein [Cyclobacteriaceae bacterium]
MLKKPITRSEHIKRLSREHHFSLLFCWKIRQGLKTNVPGERIRKYVQYFWQQHLQPHFREEEKILFAPITDRHVQRAINEHKSIRQQIEHLSTYPQNKERKTLAKIADMVDEHVRYEERELFPHLERKLSEEQLEKIGKLIQQHRSSLPDLYEDQFWNIK